MSNLTDFVKGVWASTVLDVGAKHGANATELAEAGWSGKITGLEVYGPYAMDPKMNKQYQRVLIGDLRAVNPVWNPDSDFKYDVVILDGVLQYVTQKEAMDYWAKLSTYAKQVWVDLPLGRVRSAPNGNPFEIVKQEKLTADFIQATYGPFDEIIEDSSTRFTAVKNWVQVGISSGGSF